MPLDTTIADLLKEKAVNRKLNALNGVTTSDLVQRGLPEPPVPIPNSTNATVQLLSSTGEPPAEKTPAEQAAAAGLVGARSALEAAGLTVGWDPNAKQVIVTDPTSGQSSRLTPKALWGDTSWVSPDDINQVKGQLAAAGVGSAPTVTATTTGAGGNTGGATGGTGTGGGATGTGGTPSLSDTLKAKYPNLTPEQLSRLAELTATGMPEDEAWGAMQKEAAGGKPYLPPGVKPQAAPPAGGAGGGGGNGSGGGTGGGGGGPTGGTGTAGGTGATGGAGTGSSGVGGPASSAVADLTKQWQDFLAQQTARQEAFLKAQQALIDQQAANRRAAVADITKAWETYRTQQGGTLQDFLKSQMANINAQIAARQATGAGLAQDWVTYRNEQMAALNDFLVSQQGLIGQQATNAQGAVADLTAMYRDVQSQVANATNAYLSQMNQSLKSLSDAGVVMYKTYQDQIGRALAILQNQLNQDPQIPESVKIGIQTLRESVVDNAKAVMEEMNGRGLLQSGLTWDEIQKRVLKPVSLQEQQMIASWLDKVHDDMVQTTFRIADLYANSAAPMAQMYYQTTTAPIQAGMDIAKTGLDLTTGQARDAYNVLSGLRKWGTEAQNAALQQQAALAQTGYQARSNLGAQGLDYLSGLKKWESEGQQNALQQAAALGRVGYEAQSDLNNRNFDVLSGLRKWAAEGAASDLQAQSALGQTGYQEGSKLAGQGFDYLTGLRLWQAEQEQKALDAQAKAEQAAADRKWEREKFFFPYENLTAAQKADLDQKKLDREYDTWKALLPYTNLTAADAENLDARWASLDETKRHNLIVEGLSAAAQEQAANRQGWLQKRQATQDEADANTRGVVADIMQMRDGARMKADGTPMTAQEELDEYLADQAPLWLSTVPVDISQVLSAIRYKFPTTTPVLWGTTSLAPKSNQNPPPPSQNDTSTGGTGGPH